MATYLPVAGVEVKLYELIATSFLTGFFGGVFGVGSGMLIVPALMRLNIPPAIVLTTNIHRGLPAMILDFIRSVRSSSVDLPLSLNVFAGGLCGTYLSTYILKYAGTVNWIRTSIAICYILVLGIVSYTIAKEALPTVYRKYISGKIKSESKPNIPGRLAKIMKLLPYQRTLRKSGITISILVPIVIGFLSISVFGITGISGGMIVIPSLTYLCGVPPEIAASTSTLSSLLSVLLLMFSSRVSSIDLHLSTIVFLSSIPGTALGATVARRFDSEDMRAIFACSLIAIALLMAQSMIRAPSKLFSHNIIS